MLKPNSFSITEIAAWALPAASGLAKSELHVELPALQRGSVWPARQVEGLWDSLVRGFPIGCFILSEPQPHLGTKEFRTQGRANEVAARTSAGHLLLDGQQRATAIATAFVDPWGNPAYARGDAEFVLWIDLEPPPQSGKSDHAFRLLTRSHPWGYQRSDEAERLSTTARRLAMLAYEQSAICADQKALIFRPGHLSLEFAWPHDARTPVPMPLILSAIRDLPRETDDEAIWQAVRKEVTDLLGKTMDWIGGGSGRTGERFVTGSALNEKLCAPTPYMAQLLRGLRRLVHDTDDGVRIPAQWLPSEHLAGIPQGEITADREDPVLTLFVRINTAGVQPNGEELTYSILKSVMPECRKGIEELSRKFMPPPRMVLLLSTLTLATLSSRQREDIPPAFPDVNRFRRLVQGVDPGMPNFRDTLRTLLQGDEAKAVVEAAYRLLVINPNKPDERPFRLLPLQAARIAQNDEQALLLLFMWIRSRAHQSDTWLGIGEAEHRRLVGLMCVLSWFHATDRNTATNRRQYLTRLWSQRERLHEEGILAGLTEPIANLPGPILPLPPPAILTAGIERCVTGHGFGGYDTTLWREWNFWANLQTRLDDIESASNWYTRAIKKIGDESEAQVSERREASWQTLVSRTTRNTELVLYAQRQYLAKWYPEFDPTSPTQLQDTEQPWDLDHIHPQNYVQGVNNIPPIIKAWHSTIGNVRAWPSEINRAQHDLDPASKLKVPNSQEIANYDVMTSAVLCAASAVRTPPNDWAQSHPGTTAGAPHHYLRNYYPDTHAQYQPNRQALVRAITARYVDLYAGWYKELGVKQLF